jgi:hypothetical protein
MNGLKISRRNFLKGVPLGLLGVISIGYMGSRIFSKKSETQSQSFSKSSIFSPRDKQS